MQHVFSGLGLIDDVLTLYTCMLLSFVHCTRHADLYSVNGKVDGLHRYYGLNDDRGVFEECIMSHWPATRLVFYCEIQTSSPSQYFVVVDKQLEQGTRRPTDWKLRFVITNPNPLHDMLIWQKHLKNSPTILNNITYCNIGLTLLEES